MAQAKPVKNNNKIEFEILDKKWKLRVYKRRRYNKRNGSDSVAITDVHARKIEVGPDGRDYETITHELVHAYLSELCAHSSELDVDALEEFYAELLSKFGNKLLSQARTIVKEIKRRCL